MSPWQRFATAPPPPRLLGSYDPLLHGWVARELVLGSAKGVITVNGLFRPFALVDGRAAATWSLAAGAVTLAPRNEGLSLDDSVVEATAVSTVCVSTGEVLATFSASPL